ncbi:hypothetical protein G3T14_03510 [Methylobacterium sp. BTF04]|nr:hypothetical protein [Methylobacterium sp. BTF04]
MPRYFFNIRDRTGLIDDPDGDEVASVAAVQVLAKAIVDDILGNPGTYGDPQAWQRRSFEITDETGDIVLVVPFDDRVADD